MGKIGKFSVVTKNILRVFQRGNTVIFNSKWNFSIVFINNSKKNHYKCQLKSKFFWKAFEVSNVELKIFILCWRIKRVHSKNTFNLRIRSCSGCKFIWMAHFSKSYKEKWSLVFFFYQIWIIFIAKIFYIRSCRRAEKY